LNRKGFGASRISLEIVRHPGGDGDFSGVCKNSLQNWSKSAERGKDQDVSESQVGGRWGRFAPRVVMLAGVLAWLWPIGLGGQMLVGGDTTQFSMGLMAFYRDSLHAGRLPLWNDLWGFGFPGLAESQMGVYYPPHLLLFSILSTEVASVTSLVLHFLWAALGANWAARRFGTSEIGAALAGFTWATCGFFLIHLSHQWAFTVGSWMPWAWALAWRMSRGEGSRRTPLLLAAVLALQVLPGHFQLAFVTEVGCLALALVGGARSIGRRVAVTLAVLAMIPLAAMQLWPTFQLARLSDSKRDFEYLSGFAASPIHFVSFVAPSLFHRSPLWRPVVWDPFHTSPEELLSYIGLVPLFLALGAIVRGWRGDVEVRVLAVLAGLTLLLSLGPYAPGFAWLVKLPGFSFFRAPARWGLATSLALSILGGRGFDMLASWPEAGRWVRRFVMAGFASVVVVVLVIELALLASKGDDLKWVASGFDRSLKILPWAGRPTESSFQQVMDRARLPRSDFRFLMALARYDRRLNLYAAPSLEGERFSVYVRELGETGALLVALLLASGLASRPRAFAVALLAITLADSLILARHRPFDFGPARPLVEQSPVLTRLAREPRGTRTMDPTRNLLMISGVAPIWAYRTLDLPTPHRLTELAWRRVAGPEATEPMRVAGADLRVLDPMESRELNLAELELWWGKAEKLRDPALAGWMCGVDFARVMGLSDYILLRPEVPAARAWLIPPAGLKEADGMVDPFLLIEKFRPATPLRARSDVPERVEVDVSVADSSPLMVVLSTTFDPEWQAWWTGPLGERRAAKVEKVLGGWQGVMVPEPGRWILHLEYPGRAVWVGLGVSFFAWIVWIAAYVRLGTVVVATRSESES
jgi:hypothetical protein